MVEGNSDTATALTLIFTGSFKTELGNGISIDNSLSTLKSSPSHFLPAAKRLMVSFS